MFVRMLPSDHSGDSYQSGSPSKIQKYNFTYTTMELDSKIIYIKLNDNNLSINNN